VVHGIWGEISRFLFAEFIACPDKYRRRRMKRFEAAAEYSASHAQSGLACSIRKRRRFLKYISPSKIGTVSDGYTRQKSGTDFAGRIAVKKREA
jgi:hypothetical protein